MELVVGLDDNCIEVSLAGKGMEEKEISTKARAVGKKAGGTREDEEPRAHRPPRSSCNNRPDCRIP